MEASCYHLALFKAEKMNVLRIVGHAGERKRKRNGVTRDVCAL